MVIVTFVPLTTTEKLNLWSTSISGGGLSFHANDAGLSIFIAEQAYAELMLLLTWTETEYNPVMKILSR